MTAPAAAPDSQPGTSAQPSPDVTRPPMPSEVISARAPRRAGGWWRRAMMPLGKMVRRAPRRP